MALAFYIITISLILLTSVVLYFKWSWLYWKKRNVPHLPVKFLFGNAQNIILQKASLGEEIARIYKEFKSQGFRYCGFYFFSKPILIVNNPDLIKTIMTKDFQYFTDHGNYINEEVDPLSGHLFSLKGQKWKNLRMKLTPTFTSGKMKMMFPTLVDCSHELIKIMDKCASKKNPVDIKDVVGRFTTDVIGSCAFGINCNSLLNPNSEFRKYGLKVFDVNVYESIKNFIAFAFPEILDVMKAAIIRKDVSDFFINAVKETVNYREANNVVRKDFMHLLLQLKNNGNLQDDCDENVDFSKSENATSLSINELAAQAFVFFLAGFETSSTTLTFCFYELATNTHIQEKLREEILTVLKKHNSQVTYDALMEMTYMDQCIYETLRKYPPAPILNRECTKTYKIPDMDLVIEKDTKLFIPILGIQRDPMYYPNPLNFDPDRFSSENKTKRHNFTWLPFGEGPRVCIGMRFGIMQIKVALTMLLKKYKFTLNSKTMVPIKMNTKSFILTVDGGVWLNTEMLQNV